MFSRFQILIFAITLIFASFSVGCYTVRKPKRAPLIAKKPKRAPLIAKKPRQSVKKLDLFRKKKEKKEKERQESQNQRMAEMRIPVGKVHVVRADEGFVLVESTRFLTVEPETDLIVMSGGIETARLKVSPARKGPFITADIVSGNPQVGDQVMMLYGGDAAGPGQDQNEIQVLE